MSESFLIFLSRTLQANTFSEAQIINFVTLYGTSARAVFTHASRPTTYSNELRRKMERVTTNNLDTLFRHATISHQLVAISPSATTRESYEFSFPTRHIYELLRNRLFTNKLEAAAYLYDIFIRNPNTKVPAGYLLEDAANDVFFRGGSWRVTPLVQSSRTGAKNIHWKYLELDRAPSSQYIHIGLLGASVKISSIAAAAETQYTPLRPIPFIPESPEVTLVDGYYYPTARHQSTFDAFIYEAATKTATVFQVTTSQTHSVSEKGFDWLWSLGARKFRYMAVTTPHTGIDLPFPKAWSDPQSRICISEKYVLIVDSLPFPQPGAITLDSYITLPQLSIQL